MKKGLLAKLSTITILAISTACISAAQASLTGDWRGTLDANGTTFRIALHVTSAQDGTISSTFDNIDQDIYGIKVKTATMNGSELIMSVDDVAQVNGQDAAIKGDFKGVVSTDGKEINGTWTQTEPAQAAAPVHFERVAPAPPAPPVPPAPPAVPKGIKR